MTAADRVSRTNTSPIDRTVSVKTSRKTPPGHIRTQTVILRCPRCRHVIVTFGGAHCVPCALSMLPVRGRDA